MHSAPDHADGTLVNALLADCSNLPGIGGVQLRELCIELDKGTTGAIAIVKTDLAQDLQARLQAKTVQREYLGVVYDAPKVQSSIIWQGAGD